MSALKKVRIMSYANMGTGDDTSIALGVRDGQVVIVVYDNDDETQQWLQLYGDDNGENIERDVEGFPGFILMNKETGQAIKHPIASHEPLQLSSPPSDTTEYSFLWTKQQLDGYETIREFNNSEICWDAFKGDSDIVGAKVGVWEYSGGDNQKWNVIPDDDE